MELGPGCSRGGRQLSREGFRLFAHEVPCRDVHLTQWKVVLCRESGPLDKLVDEQGTDPRREAGLQLVERYGTLLKLAVAGLRQVIARVSRDAPKEVSSHGFELL